jgi:hypothetical protein
MLPGDCHVAPLGLLAMTAFREGFSYKIEEKSNKSQKRG